MKAISPSIEQTGVRPSVRFADSVKSSAAYSPPKLPGPIDLRLDANEGPLHPRVRQVLQESSQPDAVRWYPSTSRVAMALAASHGIDECRVIVTAGGDELIERACRVMLQPGRNIVLAVPTFEIFARCATQAGAQVRQCLWNGAFPRQAMLDAVDAGTAMIVIVSPNNPTGEVVDYQIIEQIAKLAPQALIMLDLAYVEFADSDPTSSALQHDNVLVLRTFSKAFGLAGVRVGYGLASARVIAALKSVGLPYSVSQQSLSVVERVLPERDIVAKDIAMRVRSERGDMTRLLASIGCSCTKSQANFVLARFPSKQLAEWTWRALGSMGIAVRWFPATKGLEACLRITCPGDADEYARLAHALHTSVRPQAVLFDMDGVLADVSQSYRQAIIATAKTYGITVSRADVAAIKAAGNANNDWVVTQRILQHAGIDASLEEVRARFEAIYQGTDDAPGLRSTERLIPAREVLERFASRLPLAIVTGRPRADCERFLREHGLTDLFPVQVCMEDATPKPSPAPLARAMKLLGVTRAWMLGDTRDDIDAARAASIVGIGVLPPGADEGLTQILERAGAAAVVGSLDGVLEVLP
ncbi:MAG: TIGR01548 family HAD-type hydrolase [Phycisphaerae bacterium]|jgi:histidinol-phosphate aminotransferase